MSPFAHYRTAFLSLIIAALAMVVLPSQAAAQGLGVRAGVSADPDQFYVGPHYESAALVDRLHFRPNAELGFGDNATTIALNFEFVYRMPVSNLWSLYAGAGPALNIFSFDLGTEDDVETGGGLNVLFGAQTERGLFFEVKPGAIDSPDLKFSVAYTWR